MRAARRLLASVRPRQFLEAGNPTGLTGLFTHPAPRSTLLYLYNITLDRLKELPEHSIYRQSTEALTKHRYQIVKSFEPAGYAEWSKRAAEQVKKYQEIYGDPEVTPLPMVRHDNAVFVAVPQDSGKDEREVNWDGEEITAGTLEGSRSGEERAYQKELFKPKRRINPKAAQWEPEPSLEASQIMEMENQIGGGLIEEVIQVAEGELRLVDTMIESKVWEELEEKAPEGQWEYFARDRHTAETQAPSNK